MSLITCKECGKEVSDKALACPYCGVPINEVKDTKFCQHCGESIDKECVICPKCGKQVEQINSNIVINNNNTASSVSNTTSGSVCMGREKNKWVALLLCIFTVFGHKFYENKPLMGVVYLLTAGLCGVGWIIDIIILIFKPNPYYV